MDPWETEDGESCTRLADGGSFDARSCGDVEVPRPPSRAGPEGMQLTSVARPRHRAWPMSAALISERHWNT